MSKYINFGKVGSFGNNISMSGRNNSVNVNGIEINVPNGANVSVKNGKVYIDGVEYTGEELQDKDVVSLIINGNPMNVHGTSIEINGNVEKLVDSSGNVTVNGDMNGDIDAMGNVIVNGKHTGVIDAGGNVITR